MVGRLARRRPWTRRALRLAALCALITGLWWALSYHRDWLYFYFRKDTVVRDLPELHTRLKQAGLPMQAAGSVAYPAPPSDARAAASRADMEPSLSPWPVWVLRKPASAASAPTVCLMAGVHGNEPAGTEALLKLAEQLAAHREDFPDFHYVLVPLVNPWGWEHDLRHNGANQDIARQFVDGDSQESRAVKAQWHAAHCDLLVDLHEDRFHAGFYMLAYAESNLPQVLRTLQSMEEHTGVARGLNAPQGVHAIAAEDMPDIRLTTASLWARLQGVRHALIVETSDTLPLAQRVQLHLLAVKNLLHLLEPERHPE